MKVVRLEIPSGEPGTDATVRIIRQLIESGKRSLKIRYFAEWILRLYDVTARDRVGEIAAIHDWAKKNIRYLQDPYRIEYVQTPERLLVTRTGDCDDFTALVGSLVESIGYPVDIKVVAKPGRKEFHHVYPVARIGTESVGLDASMPVPLGYEAPGITRSKIYGKESNVLNVFSNIGGLGLAPLDIDIQRRGDIAPVEITGGNGIRRIDPARNGNDVVVVPTEGAGQFGPVIYLKLGQSWAGFDAKLRMDTGNLRPATANLMLVFKLTSPGTRNTHGTVTAVVKNGVEEPTYYHPPPEDEIVILPTEGPPLRKGTVGPGGVLRPVGAEILFLTLGQQYSGADALTRLRAGTVRAATPDLSLVYKPFSAGTPAGAQTFQFTPGGTITAVARKVDEIGVEPRYDVYGQPITTPSAPVVVTAPGAALDTKTMLMIGGGLLLLMIFMKK